MDREIVTQFARKAAAVDAAACRLAGTKMDGEWTGEHTTALADFLRVDVGVVAAHEDALDWARDAYAAEARTFA